MFLPLLLLIVASVLPAAQAGKPGQDCTDLRSIELTDNQFFPLPQQQSLLAEYVGQCITSQLLGDILAVVSKVYQDKGMITSRAYLQNQDISDGNILVSVLTGRVNTVNLISEGIDAGRIEDLFPRQGQVLDLTELQRAIDTIDRVPSASATFEIVPASETGFSDINVDIVDAARWMLEVGVLARNNRNADLSLALRLDNPLQQNDLLWIRHNSGEVITSTANQTANELDYSVPLWGALFSVSARESAYRQAVQGQVGSYLSEGESSAWVLQWLFPTATFAGGQWLSGLTASAERTRSFFENELIDVSSYDSEEWGVVVQYDSNHSPLTELGLEYRYLIGGGDDGESYFTSIEGFDGAANPEAVRQLLSLNLISATEDLQRRLRLTASMQTASQLLRQNRKLSLGSFATVRGYQSALSGSEGWYFGSDYEWLWWAPDNKSISLQLGLDYGEIDCEVDNRDICGSIYGLGAGWVLSDANFSAQLRAGFPLKRLPDSEADDQQWLFSLLWRL